MLLRPKAPKGAVAQEVGQPLRPLVRFALDRLPFGRGHTEGELFGSVLGLRHLVAVAVEAVTAAAVVLHRLTQPRSAVPLRVRQRLPRVVRADLRDVRVGRFFRHTLMLDDCLTDFYIASYTHGPTYPQSLHTVYGSRTNV